MHMTITYNNLEKDKPVNVSLSAGSIWNLDWKMVNIAQLGEHQIVTLEVYGSNPYIHLVGVSPKGKATDFDSVIRWFESNYPSSVSWADTEGYLPPFKEYIKNRRIQQFFGLWLLIKITKLKAPIYARVGKWSNPPEREKIWFTESLTAMQSRS